MSEPNYKAVAAELPDWFVVAVLDCARFLEFMVESGLVGYILAAGGVLLVATVLANEAANETDEERRQRKSRTEWWAD